MAHGSCRSLSYWVANGLPADWLHSVLIMATVAAAPTSREAAPWSGAGRLAPVRQDRGGPLHHLRHSSVSLVFFPGEALAPTYLSGKIDSLSWRAWLQLCAWPLAWPINSGMRTGSRTDTQSTRAPSTNSRGFHTESWRPLPTFTPVPPHVQGHSTRRLHEQLYEESHSRISAPLHPRSRFAHLRDFIGLMWLCLIC